MSPAVKEKPVVKVERSGHKIRLRNMEYPLEGTLSTREHGEIKYSLKPNVWTEVPDAVYQFLKSKFYNTRSSNVPDWNGNPDNPVRYERKETVSSYTIEFPEEYQKES